MLFLATCILGANLLTVYTLNREALLFLKLGINIHIFFLKREHFFLPYLIVFLGTKLDERRVNLLVDGPTHRIICQSKPRGQKRGVHEGRRSDG